jgi:hypothetical protein
LTISLVALASCPVTSISEFKKRGETIRGADMRKLYHFKKMKKAEPKYLKRLKEPVTIRLDPSLIAYFKDLAEITENLRMVVG